MILLDYSQIVIANVMMNKKSMSEDFLSSVTLSDLIVDGSKSYLKG